MVENESLLKQILLVQHKLPFLKAIVQMYGEPPISDKRRLHKTHKVLSSFSICYVIWQDNSLQTNIRKYYLIVLFLIL